MYKILEARNLAGNIYEMVVEAPRVAKRCLPGQFIIVKLDEIDSLMKEKMNIDRLVCSKKN